MAELTASLPDQNTDTITGQGIASPLLRTTWADR